jgi:hypothetical protein
VALTESSIFYQAVPAPPYVTVNLGGATSVHLIGTACVQKIYEIGSAYIAVPLYITGISDVQFTTVRGCTLTGLHFVM